MAETYTCEQVAFRYELFCPESGETLLPLHPIVV